MDRMTSLREGRAGAVAPGLAHPREGMAVGVGL